MTETELLDLQLVDLEQKNLAILFEVDGQRFWIGPKGKKVKTDDAYYSTSSIRNWWHTGADPKKLLDVLLVVKKFRGIEIFSQEMPERQAPRPPKREGPIERPAAPVLPEKKPEANPVDQVLKGWKNARVE